MAEGYKYTLVKLVKDWTLIIAISAGIGGYLLYHGIPVLHPAGPVLERTVKLLQPLLLFLMLFLSFCKIEPQQLRPHRWQVWLLILQVGMFGIFALTLGWALKHEGFAVAGFILRWKIVLEAIMLVLICPTATACAVVTGKLGGNMAGVITYTVLINLVVAVVIPLFIPFIHPVEGFTFGQTFNFVLVQVFPLLILPCICAWMLRYLAPKVHAKICEFTWISFYLWAFSLALAVLMCTRIIVRSSAPWTLIMEIAAAALACCIFNFWAGRRLGRAYKCKTSAGQALGQKNTVFLIWTGYSFMDPVTSVAGGFYSIWQNCFNSWQLYRRRKYLEAVNGVTDNSVD